jgi:TRAP-type C4-dicarboxylate transport system permease small subunit
MSMAAVARAWDRLIDALASFAALLIGAMALYVSYDVVARYFFVVPTSWSNDLTEYSLVWATFLAAPWLVRRGGHVRIDLLCEQLPPRLNNALSVVISIAAAIVCLIGAWQTAIETWDYYRRDIMIAKVWAVPQWLAYAAMPLGFALMSVEFLRAARRAARGAARGA